MSDYFTRLAARSAGTAAAVRPRLAALFEPPQLVAGSGLAGSAEARPDALPEMEQFVERTPTRVESTTVRAAEPPAPEAARTRAPAGQAGQERVRVVPPADQEPRAEGRSAGPAPSAARLAVPVLNPLVANAPAPWVAPPAPATAVPATTEARVFEPASARPSGERAGTPPARERTSVGRGDRDFIPAKRSLLLPERVPAEAVLRPRSKAPREPGRREPSFEVAEPVIHVTIGRVEVRATPAAAPASAVANERPGPRVMSLEEYLERRRSRRANE